MRRRGANLAVVLAALACGFSAARPAGAAAGPFREVAFIRSFDSLAVQTDGVRFAWATDWPLSRSPLTGEGTVWVFDTLRGRSFRLAEPAPGCGFVSAGGGVALWARCDLPSPSMLVTNLSTGQSRAPAWIDGPPSRAWLACFPGSIGRYWLAVLCGGGGGSGPYYLNHRTGWLTREFFGEPSPGSPFIDLDHIRVARPQCAPLRRAALSDYEPPLAVDTSHASIRLRRCGTKRAEILDRCRRTNCRTPQLARRYVTWGADDRVYAYLPRIRRRVLVGRLRADPGGQELSVAHTCDRVFARWGHRIYVARFEPRRGAPCQTENH